MNDLAQNLIEELQCETVFTIPILGGIPVSEAVVVTWIIMAVLVVVSFILTRNLKVDHISKRQAVAESIVSKRSIMAINYMENVFVVLIPEIIIWLICQKNIFGKVFMNNISELDMIKYGDWFSHCVAVPIMYLAELVIVTVIAGIVPMFIISRMKVAEVIKPVD